MMHKLAREGRESQLEYLEELRIEHIGEPNPPQVCATCYILKDECRCVSPVYWDLPAVVYKLRAELKYSNGT